MHDKLTISMLADTCLGDAVLLAAVPRETSLAASESSTGTIA